MKKSKNQYCIESDRNLLSVMLSAIYLYNSAVLLATQLQKHHSSALRVPPFSFNLLHIKITPDEESRLHDVKRVIQRVSL